MEYAVENSYVLRLLKLHIEVENYIIISSSHSSIIIIIVVIVVSHCCWS